MSVRVGRSRQRTGAVKSMSQYTVGKMYKKTLAGDYVYDAPERSRIPQYAWTVFERVRDENHGKPPYHIGGNFEKLRVVQSEPEEGFVQMETVLYSNDRSRKYVGGFAHHGLSFGTMPGFCTPSDSDVVKQASFPDSAVYVSKAWNAAKPRIEHASAFEFIAELREFPELLRDSVRRFREIYKAAGGNFQTRALAPKRVAKDFLGANFGWIPVVRDIGDFVDTYNNSARIIDRISRDNGRTVRRKTRVYSDVSETIIDQGNGDKFVPITFGGTGGSSFYPINSPGPTWELVEKLTTEYWGVGKFRYYRPEFDRALPGFNDPFAAFKRHRAIYGARLSPANVYNIVPWTWLVGWFSNAGDYVNRVSDFLTDGLVAEYFYVMVHQKRERILRGFYPFTSGAITVEARRIVETKQRLGADSPYGFGLSWDQLDPRKLAILTALGITQKR